MTSGSSDHVLRAYAIIGRAAAAFSTLEYELQYLLSLMVTGNTISAEGIILLADKPFRQKIEILNKFIPVRLSQTNPLRQRCNEYVKAIDQLRKERNYFIHGIWTVDTPEHIEQEIITLSDTRWTFDEQENLYSTINPKIMKYGDIDAIASRVERAREMTDELIDLVKAELYRRRAASPNPYLQESPWPML